MQNSSFIGKGAVSDPTELAHGGRVFWKLAPAVCSFIYKLRRRDHRASADKLTALLGVLANPEARVNAAFLARLPVELILSGGRVLALEASDDQEYHR